MEAVAPVAALRPAVPSVVHAVYGTERRWCRARARADTPPCHSRGKLAPRAARTDTHMPPHDRSGGGVGGWTKRWWRALLAEAVSTALLVYLGIISLLAVNKKPAPLSHPAWAFGLVVTGNAMVFGPASGAHMNPAVTLGAALAGRLPAGAAVGYVLAQLVGAVLGYGALLASHGPPSPGGCTEPHIGAGGAVAMEAGITALLVLACCAAWAAHDDANPDHTVPIKVGLLVAGLIFVAGESTGASLNPARSFAPALLHGYWKYHWIYWVGPLSGAALASLFHRWVLCPCPRAHSLPRLPEELPLDKP